MNIVRHLVRAYFFCCYLTNLLLTNNDAVTPSVCNRRLTLPLWLYRPTDLMHFIEKSSEPKKTKPTEAGQDSDDRSSKSARILPKFIELFACKNLYCFA